MRIIRAGEEASNLLDSMASLAKASARRYRTEFYIQAYITHIPHLEKPKNGFCNIPRSGGYLWQKLPMRLKRLNHLGIVAGICREIDLAPSRCNPLPQEGYRSLELGTSYGGVRQRWLVIWSTQAEQQERATLQKRVSQEREKAAQAWKSLWRGEFPSQEAAEEAVRRLIRGWAYHQVEVSYREVAHYG